MFNLIFKDLLPEIIFLAVSIMFIILSFFTDKKEAHKPQYILAIVSAFLCFLLIRKQQITIHPKETRFYIIDNLSIGIKFVVVLIFFCANLLPKWTKYDNDEVSNVEGNCPFIYGCFVIFSAIGMMITAIANDFFLLYIALEITAVSFYLMIAIDKNNTLAVDASVKYFISSSLFSGIYIYGLSLVYAYSGHTSISITENVFNQGGAILVLGYFMIVVAVLFKAGCAPFHMWVSDVYQGSPMFVTILLATASKVAIIVPLFRFMSFFVLKAALFNIFLKAVAILSIVIGTIVAVQQFNIKRLIAFSSISHMGYLVLMFSFFIESGLQEKPYYMKAILLYIFIYVVFLLGIFFLVTILNDKNKNASNYEIEFLSGFAQKYPFKAFLATIIILSGVAVPPLAGFFAKFYAIGVIVKHSITLSILVVLSTLISSYYYIRITGKMYFLKQSDQIKDLCVLKENNQFARIMFLGLSLLCVLFVLYADIFNKFLGSFL